MIEIFRWNNGKSWRVSIKNETLEFKDLKDLQTNLNILLKMKLDKEPYNQRMVDE